MALKVNQDESSCIRKGGDELTIALVAMGRAVRKALGRAVVNRVRSIVQVIEMKGRKKEGKLKKP